MSGKRVASLDALVAAEVAVARVDGGHAALTHERGDVGIGYVVAPGVLAGARQVDVPESVSLPGRSHVRRPKQCRDVRAGFREGER